MTAVMNEIQVDPKLVQEQMQLEMGMKDAGIVRFKKMMENMKRTRQEDGTAYGDQIIGMYIEPVAKRLTEWVEEGKGKAGAHRCAQPYIEAFDPKVVAMLGLKVVCAQLMSDQPRLSRTAIGIARMMEDELRCQSLRAQDRKSYNGIMKMAAEKGEYHRKVDVVKYLAKKDGSEWSRWEDSHCLHIGMAVINCIQDTVALIEFYTQYDNKGRTLTCMRPTTDTEGAVHKIIAAAMKFCSPMLEPTIIPPKPWVAGELKGGYWTDHIPRRPLVKIRNAKYLDQLKYADMPKVLTAVNAAQSTAWRINKDVLRLISDLTQRDSELGGVPRASLYELPLKPLDIDTNEESRKNYRRDARAVHEANVQLTGKRMAFLQVLETAKKYSQYPAIYMPAQLDFRGRVYFMPQLNCQGPDWIKGMLEFSEGKAIGAEGRNWLKVHVANLFGVDKVSFEERIQWCDDNIDMLDAIGRNPYNNRQWCDADKPFQAYAAAWELSRIERSDDPDSVISRLPVALDGSCSGIQNLSLAFRDEIGGAAVNLIPLDKPADIYRAVAEKTIAALTLIAERKTQGAEIVQDEDAEKAALQQQAARWWLEYGITRSDTKRNCMTFPYGSKQRGFSDQILEDILRPWIKEHGEPEVNAMVLSNLLAGVNFNSVQSTVVKAAEAMDWMQQAARMVAKEGRPVCWTTPLGLPVVQNYLQTKEARVETSLAGVRKVLSIREETLKPDTRKAANSISPNVVHSLDASHLMLTVANAHAEGLRSFALIHDSFGVHVADSPRFFGIIRESFVELYEGNVFADLAEQFKAQVHPDKHEEFPELPSMGRLDPQVTLDSLYSFA